MPALTRALPWAGVLSRCVAFGRPKMSVWGHAGARSAPAQVACISFTRHHRSLFWYLEVSVSSFLFQTPLHQNSLQCHSMDTFNCAPDGASARSRSPSRSLEVAPQLPNTHPRPRPSVLPRVKNSELVTTPDVVSPVDTSCPGCLAPTRRLKHTCTKARSENKRHTSPSVDNSRHAKRSGTGSAPALTALETVQIRGGSLLGKGGRSHLLEGRFQLPSDVVRTFPAQGSARRIRTGRIRRFFAR